MKSRPRRLLRLSVLLVASVLGVTVLQVAAVRFFTPPLTMTMVQQALDRGGPLPARTVLRLEDFGPHVPAAVLASEDQAFWYHHGFDLDAIADAVEHNATHKSRRGASTLTQQVARNAFLWQGGGWFRKGLEAWYTLLLELLLPKERILELYLNLAETGPDCVGFEAGAKRWYGRPAKRLSDREAASLAALLPSPRRWAVSSDHVQQRATWILAHPAPPSTWRPSR